MDRLIAELAKRQHGCVAHWQLRPMGIGRGAIEHRLKRGRLHRIHHGVYAVGHRVLGPDGWRMAAVLAAGQDAVLSLYSATELWGLRTSARRWHDVTVPRQLRSRPAIRVHQALLRGDEITVVRGIPATTVPRTILDVAATAPQREVERLIHEAEVKRLWDPLSLYDLLARYPRRPGTPKVAAALGERDSGVPKNVFEDAFVAFLDRHDLPRPETNVWLSVGGQTRDRLPLAQPAAGRGARRPGGSRHRQGVRERSREGSTAHGRRLATDARHVAPAPSRGRSARPGPARPGYVRPK
jgi:hypothetical protein